MFLKPVFPTVMVAAVCAQQQAEPSAAEKALRERVTQFYQLQVEKKFRQAEEFIAADTKDLFYNSGKPDIPGFTIVKIVMLDNDTRAEVTVKAKVGVFILGQGMVPTELPTTGTWKMEDGNWVWYVDQSTGVKTPFGTMKPPSAAANAEPTDIASRLKSVTVNTIRNQVSVDTTAITLDGDQRSAHATITNGMPGAVELMLLVSPDKAVSIRLDKTHLNQGETAQLEFTRTGEGRSEGKAGVLVNPLDVRLEVRYSVK